MTHLQKFSLGLLGVLFFSLSPLIFAQEPKEPAYRAPVKDPFHDPSGSRRDSKHDFVPAAFPSFAEREAEWRNKRYENQEKGKPAPETTRKFLIEEIDSVSGIFATQKGLGAFVKVRNMPGLLSVTEGSTFYNGSVVKIEKIPIREADGKIAVARVICRETINDASNKGQSQTKEREFTVIRSGH